MVEDNRDCSEVLIQLSACKSAVNGLEWGMFRNYIREYVYEFADGEQQKSDASWAWGCKKWIRVVQPLKRQAEKIIKYYPPGGLAQTASILYDISEARKKEGMSGAGHIFFFCCDDVGFVSVLVFRTNRKQAFKE